MINAAEALERLREGNRRFVAGTPTTPPLSSLERRALALDQEPFAVILGCADSRVPAELVFDQGFGDLFVIRVAGNIVAPSQVGSVEFAAAKFGTKLVVVMGHQSCGAITAAVEELLDGAKPESKNLSSIVDRVMPSVRAVIAGNASNMDRKALVREAVRANVRASVDHLRHGSDLLEKLVRNEGLMIVGAKYSLDTGVVAFLDH